MKQQSTLLSTMKDADLEEEADLYEHGLEATLGQKPGTANDSELTSMEEQQDLLDFAEALGEQGESQEFEAESEEKPDLEAFTELGDDQRPVDTEDVVDAEKPESETIFEDVGSESDQSIAQSIHERMTRIESALGLDGGTPATAAHVSSSSGTRLADGLGTAVSSIGSGAGSALGALGTGAGAILHGTGTLLRNVADGVRSSSGSAITAFNQKKLNELEDNYYNSVSDSVSLMEEIGSSQWAQKYREAPDTARGEKLRSKIMGQDAVLEDIEELRVSVEEVEHHALALKRAGKTAGLSDEEIDGILDRGHSDLNEGAQLNLEGLNDGQGNKLAETVARWVQKAMDWVKSALGIKKSGSPGPSPS